MQNAGKPKTGGNYVARFAGEAFQHAQTKEAIPMLRQHVSEEAYKKPPTTNIPTNRSY